MKFTIWIVQPRSWPHARMHIDLGVSIAHTLRELGHDVAFDPGSAPYVQNPRPSGRPILFGANYLPDVPLPDDAIIFNTEQVPILPGSAPMSVDGVTMDEWLRSDYLKLLRRHVVWDYSAENTRRLRQLGVERVTVCRIGDSPTLAHSHGEREDIDVLFYGTISPRRHRVLAALNEATVHDAGNERPLLLGAVSCIYGEDLDRLIARAKVVLNIHINDAGVAPRIFEMVRVAPLLANEKCVVTEDGGEDADLEDFAARATVRVPYDGLVEACRRLVASENERAEVAARGHRALRAIDQVEELRRAIEETK